MTSLRNGLISIKILLGSFKILLNFFNIDDFIGSSLKILCGDFLFRILS